MKNSDLKTKVYKHIPCGNIWRTGAKAPMCNLCKSSDNIVLATEEEKRIYNAKNAKPREGEPKPRGRPKNPLRIPLDNVSAPMSPGPQSLNSSVISSSASTLSINKTPGISQARKPEVIPVNDERDFENPVKPVLKKIDVNQIINPQSPSLEEKPAQEEPTQEEPAAQEIPAQEDNNLISPHRKGLNLSYVSIALLILGIVVYWKMQKKKTIRAQEEPQEKPIENYFVDNTFNPPGF